MKARFILAALALGLIPFAASAEPAKPLPVVVVVHVDIAPPIAPGTAADVANKMRADADDLGRRLVLEWASYCKQELGCERIGVLQQVGSLNHFTLLETFNSAEAQATFDSLPAVHSVRERIQPVLGGPLDARYSNRIN